MDILLQPFAFPYQKKTTRMTLLYIFFFLINNLYISSYYHYNILFFRSCASVIPFMLILCQSCASIIEGTNWSYHNSVLYWDKIARWQTDLQILRDIQKTKHYFFLYFLKGKIKEWGNKIITRRKKNMCRLSILCVQPKIPAVSLACSHAFHTNKTGDTGRESFAWANSKSPFLGAFFLSFQSMTITMFLIRTSNN